MRIESTRTGNHSDETNRSIKEKRKKILLKVWEPVIWATCNRASYDRKHYSSVVITAMFIICYKNGYLVTTNIFILTHCCQRWHMSTCHVHSTVTLVYQFYLHIDGSTRTSSPRSKLPVIHISLFSLFLDFNDIMIIIMSSIRKN